MLKKRIIPLLLLSKGRMVKGKKFSNYIDTGNPSTAVKVYSSQEADELMFIDIEQDKNSKDVLLETIKDVSKQCSMPLAAGGGIKTVKDVKDLLLAGADKVLINSEIIDNPKLVKEVSSVFGSQCIIGGIDYKFDKNDNKKYVYKNCGKKKLNLDPFDHALNLESLGVGEILLNSIDNDGMMEGFDYKFIKKISDALKVPLIATGGAGNFMHLVDLFKKTSSSAAACASLFHFGDNNPIRARSFLKNYNIPMRSLK